MIADGAVPLSVVTQGCQCREHHSDGAPPAEVRVDFHGCRMVAYCRACVVDLIAPLAEHVAAEGVIQCGTCQHVFLTVAAFVTEVDL